MTDSNKEYVNQLLSDGFIVLPIHPETKACFEKGWSKWTIEDAKAFWDKHHTELEVNKLKGKRTKVLYQYGRLMSDTHICIDIDLENKDAQEFWELHSTKFNDFYQELTPSGIHIEGYTKEPQKHLSACNNKKGKQIGLEIIAARHLIVTYPSRFKEKTYSYVDPTNGETLSQRLQEIPQELIDLVRNFVENKRPTRQKNSASSQSPSKPAVYDSIPTYEELDSIIEDIPSDLEYSEWLKVGMGLAHLQATEDTKDLFPLFDKFSQQSPNKYDAKATRSKWNSFDQSSDTPVTIASVLRYRKSKHQQPSMESITAHLQTVEELAEVIDAPITEEISQEDILEAEVAYISDTLPDTTFTEFPGLVGQMVREMLQRNPDIKASFAFVTACSLLSTLKAGKLELVYRSYRTPAALFSFCLAESGAGKDFFATTLSNVLSRLELHQKYVSNITSGQGIHLRLQNVSPNRPHITGNLDEAHHLFKLMANRNSQSYTQSIMPFLLQLFSANTKANFGSEAKATGGKKSEERKPINFPTVTIQGFGTTDGLEHLFTHENLSAGFVNRCLVFCEKPTESKMTLAKIMETTEGYNQPFNFEQDLRNLKAEISLALLELPENYSATNGSIVHVGLDTSSFKDTTVTIKSAEDLTAEELF